MEIINSENLDSVSLLPIQSRGKIALHITVKKGAKPPYDHPDITTIANIITKRNWSIYYRYRLDYVSKLNRELKRRIAIIYELSDMMREGAAGSLPLNPQSSSAVYYREFNDRKKDLFCEIRDMGIGDINIVPPINSIFVRQELNTLLSFSWVNSIYFFHGITIPKILDIPPIEFPPFVDRGVPEYKGTYLFIVTKPLVIKAPHIRDEEDYVSLNLGSFFGEVIWTNRDEVHIGWKSIDKRYERTRNYTHPHISHNILCLGNATHIPTNLNAGLLSEVFKDCWNLLTHYNRRSAYASLALWGVEDADEVKECGSCGRASPPISDDDDDDGEETTDYLICEVCEIFLCERCAIGSGDLVFCSEHGFYCCECGESTRMNHKIYCEDCGELFCTGCGEDHVRYCEYCECDYCETGNRHHNAYMCEDCTDYYCYEKSPPSSSEDMLFCPECWAARE